MKKLMKKKKIIIIISIAIIAVAGLLVGVLLFGNDATTPFVKNNEVPEEIKELQIVDINSTSRPYAVMINNHSDVRPYHSGLQDAFIMYEIVVEGGISRYMALFKDVETARISGIRSARHYYIDYALENDAYFIHWGGSPQAYTEISNTGINSFEVGDNHYAYRDSSLPVALEHQTYSSISDLSKAITSRNYRVETNKDLLLNYDAYSVDLKSIENNEEASKISIPYSTSNVTSFEYNEENKTYNHFVNNKAHNDYVTGEQYNFKNIITYQIENYSIPGGGSGRQEIENIGSGTGYYISEGVAIPIKWTKEGSSSQTVYTLEDGTELVVNDGNTYIALQPKGQQLSIS